MARDAEKTGSVKLDVTDEATREYLIDCVHGGLMGAVSADHSLFFDGPVEGVKFKARAVATHAVGIALNALARTRPADETPTVPAELVQAIQPNTRSANAWNYLEQRTISQVLDAVPDGWAKIDGEWVRVELTLAGRMAVRRD